MHRYGCKVHPESTKTNQLNVLLIYNWLEFNLRAVIAKTNMIAQQPQ